MGADHRQQEREGEHPAGIKTGKQAMVGDDAAKKRKRRAEVAALAEGIGKKKKEKNKRKRQQTPQGDTEGAADASPGAACTGNGEDEPRTAASGSKRRKKTGQRRPAAAAAAAAAAADDSTVGAACGTPVAVAAAAAASPQPPSLLACTSKVAEYTAVSGSSTAPSAAGAAGKKTKKKKKTKKDKRVKKGRGTAAAVSPCHATHAPSLPGRAEETNPNESQDADDADGSNSNDNSRDDGPVLEGIVHDGAMYLVDAGRKVFSAQRDEQGNLVEVGTYDKDRGEVVMADPVDLPAAGASSNPDPAKAGVDNSAGSGKNKTKGKGEKDGAKVDYACGAETGAVVDYPFEVEECDHCETSERAYADIAPLLSALAAELGKPPEELVIYDPYYCQGSTVARLAALGFPRVYNRKEDFYEVEKNGTVPEHDVVVTNPPFSGEHVPKILSFCARKDARPWFLLLPNYVYLKDFYESSLGRGPCRRSATLPFYLTPPKRYMYYSPAGSRLKVKSSERKTSPFNTFWYIRLGDGETTSKVLQSYDAVSRKAKSDAKCTVARTTQQIPYKMMDSNDPRRKKARDRQRSIDRIRKKKSEWVI